MAVKIRQEINIDNIPNGSSFGIVQLDTTQYVNPTYYFEVTVKNTAAGTDTWTLRRKGTTTDDATVSFSAGQTGRKRSAAFTPPAGQTEYIKFQSAVSGVQFQSARIIIIDNPTTLTSTETQIEIGMNKSGLTSTTATKVVPDTTMTKYWKYTAANWDGTKTFYAEVTYLMASSKSSGTFVLQEDNGSFASWTDKVTIVNAGTASAATRVRSSSFTPTDGRNYRIAYLVASSKTAATIYNAKIIVDQVGTGIGASIDSYSETNQNSNISTAIATGVGQSFTGDGNKISAAKIYISQSSSPTGNAVAKIYAHSGVFGTSSVPTGTALATSDVVDVTTLSTSPTYSLQTFTFSGSNVIQLVSGTKYVLTLEYTTSGFPAAVLVGIDNTSPTHGGNASNNNGGWSAVAGSDVTFYVYSNSGITLLEPQYLLLNTTDAGTGLQGYNTLIDKTNEWSGVTNTYKHAIDSDNASNSAKLQDIDNANADITSSAVTGANQQISADLAANLTDGHQVDVNVTNSTGVVAASRIIVGTTISAGSVITKTQTATARIQVTGTKTQGATASIQNTVTKTQTATARVQVTGNTKTQGATARIAKSFTKTQGAIAAIQNTATKTQGATARVQTTGNTKTQTATAHIAIQATSTQSATARIAKSFTKTQSATARIIATGTKTQSATARVQVTGNTKTQSAVARISKSVTKTQGAIAAIQNTATKTQTATARVANSYTKTQGAIARIALTGVTKTQSATARIASNATKTQSSIARISNIVTKTQTAKAYIIQTGVGSKTQSATARIQNTVTKTQTATARITVSGNPQSNLLLLGVS